jgi:hypothetical protein
MLRRAQKQLKRRDGSIRTTTPAAPDHRGRSTAIIKTMAGAIHPHAFRSPPICRALRQESLGNVGNLLLDLRNKPREVL